MNAASLIREARLRAGLTQAELARRAGVAQSAVSRWENGGARPSLSTLAELVRACGLDLRVGLADPDPGEASLIDQQLRLSPTQRLDQLVRTVRFVRAGRRSARTGG